MYELAPSILSADFANLGSEVQLLANNNVRFLHFDVMDGNFVPNISVGIPVLKSLSKQYDMFYDVHLMIDEPIRYVEAFASAGASLINVHLEACSDVTKTLNKIKETGKKVGITIKPNTNVMDVIPYVKYVDMVLVMTVEPGFGGQSFMSNCLDKVQILRDYADSNGLDLDIQVDGGVSLSNIDDCIKAGANVFVAGTSVFSGDIANNCKDFNKILTAYNDNLES